MVGGAAVTPHVSVSLLMIVALTTCPDTPPRRHLAIEEVTKP